MRWTFSSQSPLRKQCGFASRQMMSYGLRRRGFIRSCLKQRTVLFRYFRTRSIDLNGIRTLYMWRNGSYFYLAVEIYWPSFWLCRAHVSCELLIGRSTGNTFAFVKTLKRMKLARRLTVFSKQLTKMRKRRRRNAQIPQHLVLIRPLRLPREGKDLLRRSPNPRRRRRRWGCWFCSFGGHFGFDMFWRKGKGEEKDGKAKKKDDKKKKKKDKQKSEDAEDKKETEEERLKREAKEAEKQMTKNAKKAMLACLMEVFVCSNTCISMHQAIGDASTKLKMCISLEPNLSNLQEPQQFPSSLLWMRKIGIAICHLCAAQEWEVPRICENWCGGKEIRMWGGRCFVIFSSSRMVPYHLVGRESAMTFRRLWMLARPTSHNCSRTVWLLSWAMTSLSITHLLGQVTEAQIAACDEARKDLEIAFGPLKTKKAKKS